MRRDFAPETVKAVMGREVLVRGEGYTPFEARPRTPLHVPFSTETTREAGRVIENISDPELFNAIGSLCTQNKARSHLPLLDVDGGATLETRKLGQKLILNSKHDGSYSPTSNLRDICGDYGIDVEISEYTRLHPQGMYSTQVHPDKMGVGIVALRIQENIFDVVASTTEGHSHVYIQKEFSDADHSELIQALGEVGVLSPPWVELVDVEGMGVLRTPWTQKEVDHRRS